MSNVKKTINTTADSLTSDYQMILKNHFFMCFLVLVVMTFGIAMSIVFFVVASIFAFFTRAIHSYFKEKKKAQTKEAEQNPQERS